MVRAFLEFGLFGARVFVGFGGLAVELFGCELVRMSVLVGGKVGVRGSGQDWML